MIPPRFHPGACLLALAAFLGGAGTAQPPPEAGPLGAVAPEIAERLARLVPGDPEPYFLLAEELADDAVDEAQKVLPRALFVLAFELDRRRPEGGPLAASAALGLASIERLERDRRWLTALAATIDRRYALPDWNVAAAPVLSDELAVSAASVLGLVRAGEGREARKVMEQPGVMDVLRRYERAIGTTGETGAISRIQKYAQQWPCPDCGNERSVRRMGQRGPEQRLCPTCRGNPGPTLDGEELLAQLRFESALLSGIQRSWAAQIIVDQGAPLRDPDPDQLARYYSIDPARAYWRDGQWSAAP
ncbi:MAG: hypothetical protein WD749_10110 [Phycisphaerales bacterium]